jgi:hypothetical protein
MSTSTIISGVLAAVNLFAVSFGVASGSYGVAIFNLGLFFLLSVTVFIDLLTDK